MKINKLLIPILFSIVACGGKHTAPLPPSPPGKVTLLFPAKDAPCTAATFLSPGFSNITFSWLASGNTDLYVLKTKNLLTMDSISQSTADTHLTITLARNTPYSWRIISQSNRVTATNSTDSWKFYNPGEGAVTYAPFPADIISPLFGETVTATDNKIKLQWSGSDADNDIDSYNIFLGTSSVPLLAKSAVKDSFLANVSVVAGTIYYWRVVTTDKKKNTATTSLYQFTVK